MKFNLRHVVTFVLLIALSIGFGFGFDAIATAIEESNHPRPDTLSTSVQENAKTFGIPEAVIWATVKNGSDFASNAVSEDGRIGLMQLSSEQFDFICRTILHEESDPRTLYDPNTNLRAGSAWLSYLYGRYGIWDHVFAAYHAGTDTVDAWLQTPDLMSEQGILTDIPNDSTADYVEDMKDAVELYTTLYYQT